MEHSISSHCAVLVIDVQQGLCEGEGVAHDTAGVIERINQVSQQARAADCRFERGGM